MLVVGKKAYSSYACNLHTNVDIPDFCRSFFREHGFIGFTSEYDRKYKLPVAASSLSVRGFEVWFSGACNLKCRYCYFEHVKKGNLVEKVDSLLFNEDRFINYLKQLKFNHIFLSGGEPLLYSDLLIKMEQMMDDVGIPHFVELRVPTNGTFEKEVMNVLSQTRRVSFLISVHLENHKWVDLLRKWEGIRQNHQSRISIKILVPPGIAARMETIPNSRHYQYALVSPVSNEDRYFSLDDLSYLARSSDSACLAILNAYRNSFIVGMDTGCLRSMLYETLPASRNEPTTLRECLRHVDVGGLHSMSGDFKFKLSKMRDNAYNRLGNRPLLLTHCGEGLYLRTVDMEKMKRIDAFVNTLCLQFYVNKGLLTNLLNTQSYYYKLYNKANESVLPDNELPVAVDVDYGRSVDIRMSVRDLFTIINIMGWKVNEVSFEVDSLRTFGYSSVEYDYWLDKEGEKISIVDYEDLVKVSNDELACVRYEPEYQYISFWFIGRKKDVLEVIRGNARGCPDVPNKYYLAVRETMD